MRPRRLLLPLTLLLALAGAAPAGAAEWTVDVRDFEFAPGESRIDVGDTVTWTFGAGGHTTTARPGQAERWDSGLRAAGETFARTFTRPGRYAYVCTPHESFMAGVIQVGEDATRDTVARLRTKRRGRTVTISFTLREAAKTTYALRGPLRRTVKRGRLGAGRHSFKLRRLRPGSYRGTLTLEDDFDNKTRPKHSFRIR